MPLNILSYNLDGCGPDTYDRLLRFLAGQPVDLLCLQGVSGWQDDNYARLRDLGRIGRFHYLSYDEENSSCDLAILSRYPLSQSRVHRQYWRHCALETSLTVNNRRLTVCNLHLNPSNESARLTEIGLLTVSLSGPALLVGSFSSLSRHDHTLDLAGWLKHYRILNFGLYGVQYSVTNYLAEAGFTDTAAHLGSRDSTVPTKASTDSAHRLALRVDYAFANAEVLPLVRSVSTVKTPLTDVLSGHYPLLISLDCS